MRLGNGMWNGDKVGRAVDALIGRLCSLAPICLEDKTSSSILSVTEALGVVECYRGIRVSEVVER